MTITIARPVRRIVAVVALSAAIIGGSGGVAMADVTGRVNTAGAPLTVRSGPGTGYNNVGSLADGTTVSISCQTLGSSVSGTYGTSSWWDKIGSGRYVSDAYVYTGSDGRVAPYCDGAPGGALGNDYPYSGQTSGIDPWNFYKGQCTSFVAWRIHDRLHLGFSNYYKGQHFGNANTWDGAARAAGIPVNNTARVGAVAQWNSGSFGHVAWVTRVNSNGTVTIEEYNYTRSEAYDYRTIPAGSVENYIHF